MFTYSENDEIPIAKKINSLKLLKIIYAFENKIIISNYDKIVRHAIALDDLEFYGEVCELLVLIFKDQTNSTIACYSTDSEFFTELTNKTASCK